MANGVHLSQKSKVRNHKQKTAQEDLAIISAKYVQEFSIAIQFSTGKKKLVDFLPLFHKYVKGDNLKYFAPQNFKKFIVKQGNIYWGKNEDVIFPIKFFLQKVHQTNVEEEILYII